MAGHFTRCLRGTLQGYAPSLALGAAAAGSRPRAGSHAHLVGLELANLRHSPPLLDDRAILPSSGSSLLSNPSPRPAMVPAVVVAIGAVIALLLRNQLSSTNEGGVGLRNHLTEFGVLPPGILLLALAWRTFSAHGADGVFSKAAAWIGVPVEPSGPAGPRIGAASELGLLAGIGVIVAVSSEATCGCRATALL